MNIVSSAKIRRDLREHLHSTYPQLEFQLCKNMTEAESFLATAEILLTNGFDVTKEHIINAKNLKWIMVLSAGIDELPLEQIKNRNILVTNVSGIHAIPMAEYTIAMMLQVSRNTKALIKSEQDKHWNSKLVMNEIHGKTIGILGTGAIGQEVARLAKAFHMKTMGMNRSGREVSYFDVMYTSAQLHDIVKESDFLLSVLPKTKETDGILTKNEFALMKKNAILINIGRGNVMNDWDLLHALNNGEIAHAVLDVFNEEPLPTDHPYWRMENVTVTPHLSGISPKYQSRALEIFEANLKEFLNGRENYINKINLSKGY
ncbi:D-2-hydroxyacid dehydrogenase [Evansella sp. AB-rgal1]|uniref:D-2-hydroxyacid dehydrogenase n=1 Tax=Evansella sp. AB-rgal1 TaxID=3242696 RepID=UPI00359E4452